MSAASDAGGGSGGRGFLELGDEPLDLSDFLSVGEEELEVLGQGWGGDRESEWKKIPVGFR